MIRVQNGIWMNSRNHRNREDLIAENVNIRSLEMSIDYIATHFGKEMADLVVKHVTCHQSVPRNQREIQTDDVHYPSKVFYF